MDLNQLKYFVTVTETGTVFKAAEQLNISQPALTRSIQNLENELGEPLFDRTKNRLILNEFGKLVLEEAKQVILQHESMVKKIKKYQESKDLISIGSCAPLPLWALKYLLNLQYPMKNISTSILDNNDELIDKLNNHYYNIIILNKPLSDERCCSIPLVDEVLYLSVKKEHPLAEYKSITFDELNGTPVLCLSNIGQWLEVCKQKLPNSEFIIEKDVNIFSILQNESTLPTFRTNLIIPKYQNIENRIYIPIVDKDATQRFYAIFLQNHYHQFSVISESTSNIPWNKYNREDIDL